MSIAESVMLASGVATGVSGLLWLRSLAAAGVSTDSGDAREVAVSAPVELRTAVFVLADPRQRPHLFASTGLGSLDNGFPVLEDWVYTDYGLRVDLLMLAGQTRKTWSAEQTCDALAQILGVDEVRPVFPAAGVVGLELRVFDTLAVPAALPGIADDVDLEAVPAGVFENGDLWRVPVRGRHILIAGAMGSGKSGVLWSLVNGLGPAIADGRVQLRVIDPKGGQELWDLKPLCAEFACDSAQEMVELLEKTVEEMEAATKKYRGVRKPVPTPENPLVVTIIDEAATLSAFSAPELQRRFERAHGKLLSQGRAPLFSVIETVIDPSKENVPQRQLLPYRIGMRMDEATQVAMIHGPGARDRGSRPDQIPHSTPGVCFVQEDGHAGFRRARAFLVTDTDVDAIVAAYTPAAVTAAPVPVVVSPTAPVEEPEPFGVHDEFADDGIPGDGEGSVAA